MPAISTGAHAKALWPGVVAWWGREYDEYAPQWTDLFNSQNSDKAYEDVVEDVGFGLAAVKPQGEAIVYDTDSQGATTRFQHIAYALGYIITFEEMRDNLYVEVAKRRTPDLAFSAHQTKENVGANVYNRAFNSSFTGGDGVELCSLVHPTLGGNQANEPTAGSDLSETAIEDLCIQIHTATDSRGRKISLRGMSLHIPPALEFEANRILKSVLQSDTANNAVNALRATGSLPEGIKVNQYFTSTTQWYIRTNCRTGMLHFGRDPIGFDEDNDFDTKNLKYCFYERYSVGWGDWRGVYGNPGP